MAERSSGARTGLIIILIAFVALIAAYALGLFSVDQTKTAKLPDVDVEGGQLPEVDVDTADVDVGTKETTVEVPDVDVDVDTKEETVDVPTVDVEPAEPARQ